MRYRLVSDDDGHHFVIPADKQEEWERYVYATGDDYIDPPKWAYAVGGSPNQVTFVAPEIFGTPVKEG